jgi:acyl transferase domain-containing protein
MAAVSGSEALAQDLIAQIPGVCTANLNAPQQTVISGTRDGIAKVLAEAKQRGIAARAIPVACAFHSPLVASARETLSSALNEYAIRPPRIPVYSNTTAAPHSDDPAEIRRQLAEHVIQPVRFSDEIVAMYDAGARIFIEAGPGKVLTGLAAAALEGKPVHTIHTDQAGRNGLLQLEHALAQLAVSGVKFNAWRLFEGRVQQRLHLDSLVKETRPAPPSPTTWTIAAGRAIPPASVKKETPAPAPAATRSVEQRTAQRTEPVTAAPNSPQVLPAAPAPSTTVAAAPERNSILSSNGTSSNSAAIEAIMRGHHQLMSKFLEGKKRFMGQQPRTFIFMYICFHGYAFTFIKTIELPAIYHQ